MTRTRRNLGKVGKYAVAEKTADFQSADRRKENANEQYNNKKHN